MSADVDELIDQNTPEQLSAFIPHILHGDIEHSEDLGDVDPFLLRAMQCMQYSAQYAMHCHSRLAGRCSKLEMKRQDEAPTVEALRSRKLLQRKQLKRLRREALEHDAMLDAYAMLLKARDPEGIGRLVQERENHTQRHGGTAGHALWQGGAPWGVAGQGLQSEGDGRKGAPTGSYEQTALEARRRAFMARHMADRKRARGVSGAGSGASSGAGAGAGAGAGDGDGAGTGGEGGDYNGDDGDYGDEEFELYGGMGLGLDGEKY